MMETNNNAVGAIESLMIEQGSCNLLFAFNLGFSVDLAKCNEIVSEPSQRQTFSHSKRAPKYFEYNPPPLRIAQSAKEIPLKATGLSTRNEVEVTIYDFGVISISYRIDLKCSLGKLVELSESVYENDLVIEDAEKRARGLFDDIKAAINRPDFSIDWEDYVIFSVNQFNQAINEAVLMEQYGSTIGQILRCESEKFSDYQLQDALSARVSYTPNDIALIDWPSAFLYGNDLSDVRAVLEFANVELLEVRRQDNELDLALTNTYNTLNSGKLQETGLYKIARLQVDCAMMYEGVNNSLKLLGDQYLARIYSLASKRFHLQEWDDNILRKLETLNSIYTKISDKAENQRSHVLELIIILLFLYEILSSAVFK